MSVWELEEDRFKKKSMTGEAEDIAGEGPGSLQNIIKMTHNSVALTALNFFSISSFLHFFSSLHAHFLHSSSNGVRLPWHSLPWFHYHG